MLTVHMHAGQLREVMHAVDARGMFRRAADAAALAEREAVLRDRARAAAPAACCGPGASEGIQPGAAGSAAGAQSAAARSSGAQAAAPAVCLGGTPGAAAQAAAGLPRLASAAEPAAHAAIGGDRPLAAPANGLAARGAANGGGVGHAMGRLVPGDENSDDGEVSAPQSDEEGLTSAAADAGGVSAALGDASGRGRDEPPPPPADSAGPSPASGGGDQGPRADSGNPGARRPLLQSEDEAYARICEALAATDARLARLHAALQPNALLLVLGCQGDTFEVRRLQARRCHPPSWLSHGEAAFAPAEVILVSWTVPVLFHLELCA